VAASTNGVIGRDGTMPWHLPEDLKRFRRLTMSKPIVMGRATFDAIGRPLPGRRNIVISRQQGLEIDGCEVVGAPGEALALADGAPEIMIIGGGQVYAWFLPRADRIHLTRVHLAVQGDAFCPQLDPREWRVFEEETFAAAEGRPVGYTFQTLARVRLPVDRQ
jgi:dihydrofolate reductase